MDGLIGEFIWSPTGKPTHIENHPFSAGMEPNPLPAGSTQIGGRNGVMGGNARFYPVPLPAGTFAGTGGCASSIGVIITSPAGTGVFHFGAMEGEVSSTIGRYAWPRGSHAMICGGDNTTQSNITLQNVIDALAVNGIAIDGITSQSSAWLGSDGRWYIDP